MTEKEFIESIRSQKVNRIIHKICNNYCYTASRPDLVQDIILEVWRSLGYFKKSCSFETWVYAIAKNVCVTFRRKQAVSPVTVNLETYSGVLDLSRYDAPHIEQLEISQRYCSIIDTIPGEEKDYFLQYINGASYKEISERTGINENHLRQKIHRIKQRLKLRYGIYEF